MIQEIYKEIKDTYVEIKNEIDKSACSRIFFKFLQVVMCILICIELAKILLEFLINILDILLIMLSK